MCRYETRPPSGSNVSASAGQHQRSAAARSHLSRNGTPRIAEFMQKTVGARVINLPQLRCHQQQQLHACSAPLSVTGRCRMRFSAHDGDLWEINYSSGCLQTGRAIFGGGRRNPKQEQQHLLSRYLFISHMRNMQLSKQLVSRTAPETFSAPFSPLLPPQIAHYAEGTENIFPPATVLKSASRVMRFIS